MRKKISRNLAEALRDEMFLKDKVMASLREQPRTIPELARGLGYPSSEVLRWVMALRRYGKIVDVPKARADDYYQYKATEEK